MQSRTILIVMNKMKGRGPRSGAQPGLSLQGPKNALLRGCHLTAAAKAPSTWSPCRAAGAGRSSASRFRRHRSKRAGLARRVVVPHARGLFVTAARRLMTLRLARRACAADPAPYAGRGRRVEQVTASWRIGPPVWHSNRPGLASGSLSAPTENLAALALSVPGRWLARPIAAHRAHLQCVAQVRGEFGVHAVQLGHSIANARADGLAGPLGLIA